MKKLLVVVAALTALVSSKAWGQQHPGYCDCYAGMAADGTYWNLLDAQGHLLENGDWAYAVWVGPDGEIDPPGADGYPTDDDVLLPTAQDCIEYGNLFTTVTIWELGRLDSLGHQMRPADGDLVYCRIFDGSKGSIGPDNYYADSQLHQLEWKMGDVMFCLFPGDPGKGHTDTPVPAAVAGSSSEAFELRQIYPNLLKPETRLEYGLPTDAPSSLRIFDLQGRAVRTLVNQQQGGGWHTSTWDGRDDQGQEAGDGIYYCRLRAGDLEKTVRVVLFR